MILRFCATAVTLKLLVGLRGYPTNITITSSSVLLIYIFEQSLVSNKIEQHDLYFVSYDTASNQISGESSMILADP